MLTSPTPFSIVYTETTMLRVAAVLTVIVLHLSASALESRAADVSIVEEKDPYYDFGSSCAINVTNFVMGVMHDFVKGLALSISGCYLQCNQGLSPAQCAGCVAENLPNITTVPQNMCIKPP